MWNWFKIKLFVIEINNLFFRRDSHS
jgi:hypothetical protein